MANIAERSANAAFRSGWLLDISFVTLDFAWKISNNTVRIYLLPFFLTDELKAFWIDDSSTFGLSE